MDLVNLLRSVEIFNGLDDDQLGQIAALCSERSLHLGEKIATQGSLEDDLYIVTRGFVEVLVNETHNEAHIIVSLGEGQTIGEMALVDQGPRSATVRSSVDGTVVQVMRRLDFEDLCSRSPQIGYVVMRNIALDLSFKLRHRNLSLGGR